MSWPARAVVTGGAGLIGSHLCERLVEGGTEVVCVDDLSTGRVGNLAALDGHPRFSLVVADVVDRLPVEGPIDAVCHLASPASPPDYLARPIDTLRTGAEGTRRALELASAAGARFLLASTSEVYGDPLEHPQHERYWGNVNPVGPRSVYDESKRYAEALTTAYRSSRGADTAIARIFNTYGPRLRPGDGRVVSSFVVAALEGRPLPVHGDGRQTRSFCYVDDQVTGLLALLRSSLPGPVNIGNPEERTVAELADLVIELTSATSTVEHLPLPEDDPTRRCPDITLATSELGWRPAVDLTTGLRRTIEWFRRHQEPVTG